MGKRLLVGGPFDGTRLEVMDGERRISVPAKLRELPNGAETETHVYRSFDLLVSDPIFVHESLELPDAIRLLMKRYTRTQSAEENGRLVAADLCEEHGLQEIALELRSVPAKQCEHYWNSNLRCELCGVLRRETGGLN